jgi:DNA-binding response OmpR family regulator
MQKKPIQKNQIIIGGSVDTLGRKNVRALQNAGYVLMYVSSGKEVREQCIHSPDTVAVIIDGDRDGFSPFCELVDNYHNKSSSPLIILTSVFRLSAVALALQEGFDEFLAKPIGKEELFSLIRKANKYSKNYKSLNSTL